jgi:tellurite resistance protein TerC
VDIPIWAWAAVAGFIIAMLAMDLLVLHRHGGEVSAHRAAVETAMWILVGIGFGFLVSVLAGPEYGGQYFAGYLTEKALSVDNLFLFTAILGAFAIPVRYQHRVLFWGVFGALATRAAFVAFGATVLADLSWAIEALGLLLLVVAWRMLVHGRPPLGTEELPRTMRLLRRVLPITNELHGPRFVVRMSGGGAVRWAVTPLLVALVAIEVADVVMAADSVPAVFGLTREPFLVFTSNAFAVVGLRALYFLLVRVLGRLEYLRLGLAAILAFVGAKMLLSGVFDVPLWASLVVILTLLAASSVASLSRSRGPVVARQRHAEPRSLEQ